LSYPAIKQTDKQRKKQYIPTESGGGNKRILCPLYIQLVVWSKYASKLNSYRPICHCERLAKCYCSITVLQGRKYDSHWTGKWLKLVMHFCSKDGRTKCSGEVTSLSPRHLLVIVSNYSYYYIRLTAFFSRTTWVSRHQKGKPFWILLEQEIMGWHTGSGISWTTCKSSAPRCRQITTPVPYLTTQFLHAGCPFCHPTNSVKALS